MKGEKKPAHCGLRLLLSKNIVTYALIACYACYHSVQNLLSSRLLSKNIRIGICNTIILPWFCMGVKLGLWH
jgi:hypothetical protein